MLKQTPTLLLLACLGSAGFLRAQGPEDPRAVFLMARARQLEEDPLGAATLYRRVVALMPESAEAHLRLSEALAGSGDRDGALGPALRATELNPRNTEAWIHLGLLQAQAKNPAQAKQSFLKATRLLPGHSDTWVLLARVNQATGDREGAMKALLSLGRLHPSGWIMDLPAELFAWENAADLAKALGRYEARREAVMALGDLPNPTTKHLRMLEELAREQADNGFLGHAEESFLLLGRHFPEEPAIWENAGHIQLQTGRYEAALESLRKAASLNQSLRSTYFQGICLMRMGRLAEAEPIWRSILTKEETSKEFEEIRENSRSFLASIMSLQGRNRELIELVQGAPADTDGDLASLKTQALIRTQDWKAARQALIEGLRKHPDRGIFEAAKTLPSQYLRHQLLAGDKARRALVQIDQETTAALWAEFQQWDKSLEMVHLARQSGPIRRLETLMVESNALDQKGRFAEAMQVLRTAHKLYPDSALVMNNLGYLLLEHGNGLEEASRLIQAAMAQDSKSGSTVDSWGWVLFKQGKLAEAEDTLRKAVELTPYSPEIRMHLGEVLVKAGRPDEALEHWERALAYTFPQRKELEEKVRQLRARLARENEQEPAPADSAPETSALPEADLPDEAPQDDEDIP